MWLNKATQIFQTRRPALRFLICLILGVLASLGQAPFGLPMVSLLGFAAGFAILDRADTGRQAAKWGWAFALGYFALTLQWLVSPFFVEPERHGWMAPFAVVFMAGGLALFWGGAFAAAKRFGPIGLVITLPLAELLRAFVFTGFPWGMPAYGLVDRMLAQGAGVFGAHGLNIVFLLLGYAGFALCKYAGKRRLWAGGVFALGLLTLLPGPAPMVPAEDAAVLRLVQPNAPQHQKWDPDYMGLFYDRALQATRAEGSVDLILWPETSLPGSLPGASRFLAEISEAAGDVPFVIGANRFDNTLLMNSAVLVDGAGAIAQIYDKHHLVPFGEYMPLGELLARYGIQGLAASEGMGFFPGAGATLMDLGPLGKALPLICYEAVFPQDVNGWAERPDFLLQITNDAWFGTFSGPYQHLAQAQMRAIEQGLPFVRVANTGVSAMIDARGRVLQALPLNTAGHLDVALPQPLPQTLYSKTGDWAVFLLLLAGLLILSVRKSSLGVDPKRDAH